MLNIKSKEQEDVACSVRSLAMTELSHAAAELLNEFSNFAEDDRTAEEVREGIGVLSVLIPDFITNLEHTCKMFSCKLGLLLNPNKVYIWSENESPAEIVDLATYKNESHLLNTKYLSSPLRHVDIMFIRTSIELLNMDIKKILFMYNENKDDLAKLDAGEFSEVATRIYRNASTLCSSYSIASNYGVDGILLTFGDNVKADIGITS